MNWGRKLTEAPGQGRTLPSMGPLAAFARPGSSSVNLQAVFRKNAGWARTGGG